MDERRTRVEHPPVMVGVDGSAGSWAAVALAAWEARRRHAALLLVHGYTEPVPYTRYGWAPLPSLDQTVRDEARSMLTDMELRTRSEHPGLAVRATLVAGGGASTLVELSRTASLVVVGSRGHGGFAGLTIGSVGAQVAAHAHAPVIVMRPPDESGSWTASAAGASKYTPGPQPVVVGIDGSPASAAALSFAFEEASARETTLAALHVWWGPSDPFTRTPQPGQQAAELMLAEMLAGWSEKQPEVQVRRIAQHDPSPQATLIDASMTASLVVVGTRGRGGFASALLGSVSRAVVSHAHCPVAVIREH